MKQVTAEKAEIDCLKALVAELLAACRGPQEWTHKPNIASLAQALRWIADPIDKDCPTLAPAWLPILLSAADMLDAAITKAKKVSP